MPKTKDVSKDQKEIKNEQTKKHKCPEKDHMLPGTRNVMRASSKMLGSTDRLKRLIKIQKAHIEKEQHEKGNNNE